MTLFANLALALILGQQQDAQPLRFKVGDIVAVAAPEGYGGTYTVLSDGAIYGKGWGRVAISGLTWEESQKAVRKALSKFVKNDDVFLTIVNQKRDVVYIVGLAGNQGPVTWEPGLSLRKLLSGSQFQSDLDQTKAALFRGQQKVTESTLDVLLRGNQESDPLVQPGDVVAVTALEKMRVWVSGAVRNPGEVKVPIGSDLSRVLAAAGGADVQNGFDDGVQVLVRRGPTTTSHPARSVSELSAIPIEAGDDVSVVFPQAIKVTVDGKVQSPGEYAVKGTGTLAKAIAMAGGVTPEGTLNDVMVVRSGAMHMVKATDPLNSLELKDGDLVVVPRNERVYYVFGEVNAPGRFKMEDGRSYRALDALASAGGLGSRGVMRRVYLSQRGADGKVTVRQIAPDEYLRHGDEDENPILAPGDSLLFTRSDGLSFSAAAQMLTSLVLVDSLTRSNP